MFSKEIQDAIQRELVSRENIRSGSMAEDGDSFAGLPGIDIGAEIELLHGALPESEEGSSFMIDAYLPFGVLIREYSSTESVKDECKPLKKFFVPYANIKFVSEYHIP